MADRLADLEVEVHSLRELLKAEVERGNRRVAELDAAREAIVAAACEQAVANARLEWEAAAVASGRELEHTRAAVNALLECQDELRNAALQAEAKVRRLEEMLAASSASRGRFGRSISRSPRPAG